MKQCFKCGELKDLDCFYKHNGMKDGLLNKCKDCCRSDVKANREKNSDYYKKYDAERYQKDPRVRARHKAYQKTEAGKASIKKSKDKWLEANKVKRKAHVLVGNHIRSGKLIRPESCECCGAMGVRINAHHDDYRKPLDVRWLCGVCHYSWHKENGEGKI